MLDKTKPLTMIPYDAEDAGTARVFIRVHGVSSLLTHNPQSMGIEVAPGKGSRIPSAEDEAEAGCYRLEDGSCALKGEAFRSSILGAAGAWKAKNKRTMRSILSHVIVVEEFALLQYFDGKPIKDYAIDARRAIIQKQGIIRRRPRFDQWSCGFHVEYDPQLVTDPRLIVDVCADAGKRIGVGDYRPSKNGPFGRYTVHEFAIIT